MHFGFGNIMYMKTSLNISSKLPKHAEFYMIFVISGAEKKNPDLLAEFQFSGQSRKIPGSWLPCRMHIHEDWFTDDVAHNVYVSSRTRTGR